MKSTEGVTTKRRSRRKDVTLRGVCIYRLSDIDESGGDSEVLEVTVENISKHGVGLKLMTPAGVAVNDVLKVKFVLEGKNRVTVVEKDIVVRWIKGDIAGAEFVDPIDNYESEIDFYLLGKRLSIFELSLKE